MRYILKYASVQTVANPIVTLFPSTSSLILSNQTLTNQNVAMGKIDAIIIEYICSPLNGQYRNVDIQRAVQDLVVVAPRCYLRIVFRWSALRCSSWPCRKLSPPVL